MRGLLVFLLCGLLMMVVCTAVAGDCSECPNAANCDVAVVIEVPVVAEVAAVRRSVAIVRELVVPPYPVVAKVVDVCPLHIVKTVVKTRPARRVAKGARLIRHRGGCCD